MSGSRSPSAPAPEPEEPPPGDSAGVYYLSIEEFEAREPPRESEADEETDDD